MKRMLLLFVVLTGFACQSGSKEESLADIVPGDWIVLYPDVQFKDDEQRAAYRTIEDSVVSSKSLKLVSFAEGGRFHQLDDLSAQGRWDVKQSSALNIQEAGKGFENFKTSFIVFEEDIMQLAETVRYQDQRFRLIWHCWKADKKTTKKLFSAEANSWRIRPRQPESNEAIKNRLATMLRYYAEYFYWVAKESTFFIGKRVLLPFEYYQHSIGTGDFDPDSEFAALFYDRAQAEKAYEYLQDVVSMLKNQFDRNKNYVKGYAAHMELMAEKITSLP